MKNEVQGMTQTVVTFLSTLNPPCRSANDAVADAHAAKDPLPDVFVLSFEHNGHKFRSVAPACDAGDALDWVLDNMWTTNDADEIYEWYTDTGSDHDLGVFDTTTLVVTCNGAHVSASDLNMIQAGIAEHQAAL